MSEQIKDGTGKSFLAKVDGNNRLNTATVSQTETEQALKKGRAYNLNTGVITLTNDTETPILYFKNNETEDVHITAIVIGINHSTGGSATDMNKITIIRNPTAGTIVSGTNGDISSNRNYGSANTLTADFKKGATGSTMTDGDDHIIIFHSDGNRLFATIAELLPKGSTLGIKVEPVSGNTSMEVYAALICHLEDPDE